MNRFFLPLFLLLVLFVAAAPAGAQTPTCPSGQVYAPAQSKCIPVPTGSGGAVIAPTPSGNGAVITTTPAPSSDRCGNSSTGSGLTNPLCGINSLKELLNAVLGAVVQIGSIILVLALVYVGFLFVVAQGNEEKIRDARSALLWTVIGGLILLGASAIGLVIESTANTITS